MTHKSPFFKIALSVSTLSVFLTPAIVQAESSENMPQIVVTATRTANTVDETLAPVTIISQEDIKRTQASSLSELLRATPSISLTSNGGFGSNSGISLRGTNTDHVLYMIDGVPIGSATSGTTAIQYIPLSQVERIEIVRGPRSSLYGSDAIGGVIQIFTKKDSQKNITASAGYGSDNTREVTASYANSNEQSYFSGGLSAFNTDGYDFFGHQFAWPSPAANAADEDDDGYENYSLSLNAGHQVNNDLKLSGIFLRSQGENEYDGYGNKNTRTEFTEQLLSGTIDLSLSDLWTTHLKLSRNYDKQYNQLSAGTAQSKFNTKTDLLSWQNDITIRDYDLLSLGIDYKDDKVDSSTEFSEKSRWNKAVFAQYQYLGDIFNTQVSVRYDDNEAFGSHNTWNMGTGFNLDKNVRITTSYGTAYKAPTFNDMYWPADAFYSGNPDLKPEESKTFDFGVEITTGNTLWTAHYFATEVTNLITYVSSYPAVSMMENVDEANIDGVELTVATELFGWQLGANASFIDPIDDSTGKMLSRRSKRNLNISLDSSSGAFSYGASVTASSERFNKTNEREQLPGFGLMNIRAAWSINQQWTLKAKVDNLFDKQYVLTQSGGIDCNQPDRFIFTSIHYEM
ncbi:TonB-dependent receptor domain-containing protein [sulfur-oxidizing endosymbiont of Gigantopelta aegis]|uniref:TonB-dependent receptor domain-containing protein n=1 Tax=sulfur-oxidizing endosymbiont of Gigantopelta aegis TaxID=2794934 RepID=UPI0018DD8757|nr:TonB-dependent receptor [sulfur-oxidizing endosymbiont of Gigantopelta aegis]